MYFGWISVGGPAVSKPGGRASSEGVSENSRARKFRFSERTRFGRKFICAEDVLLGGRGVEQLSVRQMAMSVCFGSACSALFSLQHFIGQTFLSIPFWTNVVPAGTLATSRNKKQNAVNHLVMLFLIYFNRSIRVNGKLWFPNDDPKRPDLYSRSFRFVKSFEPVSQTAPCRDELRKADTDGYPDVRAGFVSFSTVGNKICKFLRARSFHPQNSFA